MDSLYNKIKGSNIVWQKGLVTRADRNTFYGHQSGLVWFTGLPSSGKSTIAHGVEKVLFDKGVKCYVLDGDNVRYGLNADLGFSEEDRRENIRRIVEVSKLMVDAGLIVLTAFVSPFKKDREYIKRRFKNDNFIEIYVKCSVEECIARDPKGNYQKAMRGIIKNYTGISSPYEEPENPDIILNTEKLSVKSTIKQVLKFLKQRGWLENISL